MKGKREVDEWKRWTKKVGREQVLWGDGKEAERVDIKNDKRNYTTPSCRMRVCFSFLLSFLSLSLSSCGI